MASLRAMVVDDSAVFRAIMTQIINSVPNVRVVTSAENGKTALDKIKNFQPDFVTLDLEMPVMDGIATLEALQQLPKKIPTIMVSAHTQAGAAATINCLEKGAYGFVAKPTEHRQNDNKKVLAEQLFPLISGLFKTLEAPVAGTRAPEPPPIARSRPLSTKKPDIIAIGISTGGPNALTRLIPTLPEGLPVPVVIVQHMPAIFTASLAESLDKKSEVKVVEGKQGDRLKPGHIYIAPGGKQMKVVSGASAVSLAITDDPPENNCKPSADFLFRSVAREYGEQALGVIMTGMGNDGTLGLKRMKRHNIKVIGQNRESCVVYGMPAAAMKAGVVDVELPLEQIGKELVKSVNR